MRKGAQSGQPTTNLGDVRAWLKDNPDFLVENQDLLRLLTPPAYYTSDDADHQIADFQQFMVQRLREEVEQLSSFKGTLLAASRSNLASQQQIHSAALAAMDASSLEHLIHVVTGDWVDMLGVDVVVICFESTATSAHLTNYSGLTLLAPDTIYDLMGSEGAIMLRDNVTAPSEVFGPATPLVKAEALVTLDSTAAGVPGMLALGSRDPECFAPGQGTELLRFLASTLERMLRLWLKLAP